LVCQTCGRDFAAEGALDAERERIALAIEALRSVHPADTRQAETFNLARDLAAAVARTSHLVRYVSPDGSHFVTVSDDHHQIADLLAAGYTPARVDIEYRGIFPALLSHVAARLRDESSEDSV
jgi:hypothetical protein